MAPYVVCPKLACSQSSADTIVIRNIFLGHFFTTGPCRFVVDDRQIYLSWLSSQVDQNDLLKHIFDMLSSGAFADAIEAVNVEGGIGSVDDLLDYMSKSLDDDYRLVCKQKSHYSSTKMKRLDRWEVIEFMQEECALVKKENKGVSISLNNVAGSPINFNGKQTATVDIGDVQFPKSISEDDYATLVVLISEAIAQAKDDGADEPTLNEIRELRETLKMEDTSSFFRTIKSVSDAAMVFLGPVAAAVTALSPLK